MPRSVRKERNRELFRTVNETIAALEVLSDDAETLNLVCECRSLGCAQLVEVPAAVYSELAGDGSWFVVRREHEDAESEVVVADHGTFLVVRDR